MSKHLQRDLDLLRKDLLTEGTIVEGAINKAMRALLGRCEEIVEEVLAGDEEIDEMEVQIEESCLKILALHQPVATDLRFVITVMKVNNDLERMGDLAVNIAKRAKYLNSQPPLELAIDIEPEVDRVRSMVQESLDALVNLNTVLARKICADDDIVDRMNKEMLLSLQSLMKREPGTVERALQMISVSRHLERIADLATNIAEDVIFMVEGDVIRHGKHEAPVAQPAQVDP